MAMMTSRERSATVNPMDSTLRSTWSVGFLNHEKRGYPIRVDVWRRERELQFQSAHIVKKNLGVAATTNEKMLIGRLVIERLEEKTEGTLDKVQWRCYLGWTVFEICSNMFDTTSVFVLPQFDLAEKKMLLDRTRVLWARSRTHHYRRYWQIVLVCDWKWMPQ